MPRAREYDKAEVIDAATQVFWRNGYEASSIQKLLNAMRINRGSLYAAFSDKQTLFKQVMDTYTEGLKRMVAEHRAEEGHDDPVGSLERFFEKAFINQGEEGAANGCLLFNTITELSVSTPDLAVYAAERVAPVRAMFHYYVDRAKALGMLDPEADPSVLTEALLATVAGLRVLCKMGMPKDQLKKVIVTTVRSLLRKCE